MSIEDWRAEIDEIDDQLLRLLNMRARLAAKIGKVKRVAGLPLSDEEREGQVVKRMQSGNAGPLDEVAVMKLFECIIRESRRVESAVVALIKLTRRISGNDWFQARTTHRLSGRARRLQRRRGH